MHPGILPAIQKYLNDRTLPMPGKTEAAVPGYLIRPYVAWTVKLPRENMPKDIQAEISGTRLRDDVAVGAIIPGNSRVVRAVRGPYSTDQERAGQIREMTIYLPMFFRSLKALPYEAAIFWYEDLLVEMVKGIDGSVHPHIESVSVSSVVGAPEAPDFFVLEAEATITYLTDSRPNRPIPLRGIDVMGLLELLARFEAPDATSP